MSVLLLAVVSLLAAGQVDADDAPARADVLAVTARGAAGRYHFAVTLRSPDTGCARFARWWEVVSPEGTLLYRRILLHSHVDEQPFRRAGGPIRVEPDQTLIVRAYLHPDGYGGSALRGSVAGGFSPWSDAPSDFAVGLADAPPQPSGCRH